MYTKSVMGDDYITELKLLSGGIWNRWACNQCSESWVGWMERKGWVGKGMGSRWVWNDLRARVKAFSPILGQHQLYSMLQLETKDTFVPHSPKPDPHSPTKPFFPSLYFNQDDDGIILSILRQPHIFNHSPYLPLLPSLKFVLIK